MAGSLIVIVPEVTSMTEQRRMLTCQRWLIAKASETAKVSQQLKRYQSGPEIVSDRADVEDHQVLAAFGQVPEKP